MRTSVRDGRFYYAGPNHSALMAITAMLLLVAAGCGASSPATPTGSGTPTTCTATGFSTGSMSAIINGVAWTAVCVKAVAASGGAAAGLAITGTDDPMGRTLVGRAVDIAFASNAIGSFPINSGFVSTDGTSFPFGPAQGSSGTTTITTFRSTGTGTNVAGAFTVVSGVGGQSVSNGTFNISF
jgi:hypothetical protein